MSAIDHSFGRSTNEVGYDSDRKHNLETFENPNEKKTLKRKIT